MAEDPPQGSVPNYLSPSPIDVTDVAAYCADRLPKSNDVLASWLMDVDKLPDRELSSNEMVILACFIKGYSHEDIAQTTESTIPYVKNVLALPRAEQIFSKVEEMKEKELRGLKGIAVDTIRDILQNGSPQARASMVDKYFKIVGRYEEDMHKQGSTAEDVIAKIMRIVEQQASSINALTNNTKQNILNIDIDAPIIDAE